MADDDITRAIERLKDVEHPLVPPGVGAVLVWQIGQWKGTYDRGQDARSLAAEVLSLPDTTEVGEELLKRWLESDRAAMDAMVAGRNEDHYFHGGMKIAYRAAAEMLGYRPGGRDVDDE